MQSKDKQSLIDYRNTLAHNSPEYIHAGTAIDNPVSSEIQLLLLPFLEKQHTIPNPLFVRKPHGKI